MDYYCDDYPEAPPEGFLAVYEQLSRYAKREIHDLAQSLAATTWGARRRWPSRSDWWPSCVRGQASRQRRPSHLEEEGAVVCPSGPLV
jgi:hypothetical protein